MSQKNTTTHWKSSATQTSSSSQSSSQSYEKTITHHSSEQNEIDQHQETVTPRILLFLSTSLTLPIVQILQEKGVVAGVIITARMDADSVHLEQQLAQLQIPSVRWDMQQADVNFHHIKNFAANVGLIITFSHILPQSALDCFEFGVFNVHASNLPKYRGANPLFWQLKDNAKTSAVVIHHVDAEVDHGAIVASYKFDIHPLDTFGTLSGTVFQIMPILINEFLTLFHCHHGILPLEVPQQGESSKAPQPTQEHRCVNWRMMGAKEISALARACNPNLGGAQIVWKNAPIGLMQASLMENKESFGVEPGVIIHIGEPEGLLVATVHGVLRMDALYMMDGIFTGLHFAQRFSLNAGEKFLN